MSKRILLISPQPFFQWRGSPIRVKFNLMALVKLGYDVDLLTLPIGEDQKIEGVNIYRVVNPFRIKNIPIGPSLWKIFFDKLIFLYGISLCLKNKYEIIHGIEEAGFIAAVLSKFFNTETIYEKHSDPVSHKKGLLKNIILKIYSHIEKISVRMAKAVICTGPGLFDQVNNMNTLTRAFNIFDIPSSLKESSEDDAARKRAELLLDSQEILITFVGSFAVYQGVDLLFAAIPEVIKSSERARFIIIGGNSSEIKTRRLELEKQGVLNNVTFVGKIPPDILPDYLKASDILLSPRSSGVNTPLKILDYMKAGKSIVATDHPANKRLLEAGGAVLCNPDPGSFSKGILSLIHDEEKRDLLGQTCRKTYEGTFTFDHHCQRLADCYNYVLNQ